MLRSKVGLASSLVALALALPAASGAGGSKAVGLEAKLRARTRVPGPGSPKGKGDIHILVKAPKGKLCFNFEVSKLDPITEGHIHKGNTDESGPVKVTLFQDQTGLAATAATRVASSR